MVKICLHKTLPWRYSRSSNANVQRRNAVLKMAFNNAGCYFVDVDNSNDDTPWCLSPGNAPGKFYSDVTITVAASSGTRLNFAITGSNACS